MKLFMIQHKTTKKWSQGGLEAKNKFSCRWTEKKRFGKIWRGTGPLKNHLNQFSEIRVADWDIVEFDIDFGE